MSQEQSATTERYKGEVARLEALLAEKDLALNRVQADCSGAQGEVVLWHRSSEENWKQVEGVRVEFLPLLFLRFRLIFLTFVLLFCFRQSWR